MNPRAATATAALSLAFAALTSAGVAAAAEPFPTRPIKLIVPYAAGVTTDLLARQTGERAGRILGQPIVVENRTGASGIIGTQAVAKSAPDGYTLVFGSNQTHATNAVLVKNLPYDPIKDFTPVALGATFQFAIAAGPASGAKNWSEFAAWAKANPTKAGYATSGAGSLPHFFGVLLGRGIGVEMVHVPYKGSAAYLNDLVGGQVPAAIDAIADLTELHRAGKVKVLASSGATRSTALPDVPTFGELGVKGVEAMGWFGFFAPAKTPKPIVDALNAAINKALQSPDVAEKLSKLGMDPATGTPEQFAAIVVNDYNKWGPIVKASGFKPD